MKFEPRSYEEWVKLYEEKTNEKVEADDGFHLFYLPDKGFCRIDTNMEHKNLIIKEMCGDGLFWNKFARELAEKLEMKTIATFLSRPVDIIARHFGGKLISEENGIKKYVDRDNHLVEAIPYNDIYIILQHLDEVK